MQKMQAEMDESFNEMFRQFGLHPGFDTFTKNPSYSSSSNMQDLRDRYEIRLFLPGAKNSEADVTLENGQTLKVSVTSKTGAGGETNGVAGMTEWGDYEQDVRLPTPGKADKMTVKRAGNELVITIPKA